MSRSRYKIFIPINQPEPMSRLRRGGGSNPHKLGRASLCVWGFLTTGAVESDYKEGDNIISELPFDRCMKCRVPQGRREVHAMDDVAWARSGCRACFLPAWVELRPFGGSPLRNRLITKTAYPTQSPKPCQKPRRSIHSKWQYAELASKPALWASDHLRWSSHSGPSSLKSSQPPLQVAEYPKGGRP